MTYYVVVSEPGGETGEARTGIVSVLGLPDERDTLKMLRETLNRAQTAIGVTYSSETRDADLARLGRLIVEIDRQRPLGPDGKHGDLHTPTCGCEDR